MTSRAIDNTVMSLGWLLLAGFVLAAAGLGSVSANVRMFQICYLAGFVGYLSLVWWVVVRNPVAPPGRWRWWLAGCLMLRVLLLATEPSDDTYRYVWEGRVQRAGFNPFVYPPDDERLAHLRNEDWSKINHPDYAAIYPPVAQIEFLIAAAIAPSVYMIKCVHVLWDMLVVAVLGACLRRLGRPPHAGIIYGLCPLVLTAFGIEGHVDSLMLLFAAGSVWAVTTDRPVLAGIMLGLAISTKLVLIVLLPWFLLHHRKAAVTAIATVVLTYLPYSGAGADLFASLTRFSSSGTVLSLLSTIGLTSYASFAERAAVVAVLGVTLAVAAWRCRSYADYGLAATGGLLMLMPIVHFWYFTWAVLFTAFVPRLRWIAGAAAMVGYFEAAAIRDQSGVWSMPDTVAQVLWGSILLAWAAEALFRRARARSAGEVIG